MKISMLFPRPLRAGLCALIIALVGSVKAAGPKETFAWESLRFESGGQAIHADFYHPDAPGPHPAVLVLHGAGGMVFDGPEMRRVAEQLARAGNAVYLVHYFNRTGTLFARDAVMQEHFETWLATVRDALAFVQRRQGTSATPVGIYGYSLGAFLAVAAASDDPRVGAIAEQAGGVWNGKEERIATMPPVLMIHGRADQRVPFDKYARPLLNLLKRRGAAVETRFFPGEGHGFSPATRPRARDEAAAFFARRLRAAEKKG